MPGTKEGAAKAKLTIATKYGQDFFAVIGRAGGKAGTGHEYAHGKVSPSENGRKGSKNRWKNRVENREQSN